MSLKHPLENIGKYLNLCKDIVLTSVAWVILTVMISRVLVAVGWYLIAVLWKHELFIPASIRITAITVFLLVLWGTLIFLLDLVWAKFNYHRYFRHNRRQLDPFDTKTEPLSWKEITIDPSKISKSDTGNGQNEWRTANGS